MTCTEIVGDESILLQEREYYSASECTDAMKIAYNYYHAKAQHVLIEMFNKLGYLIASLENKP